MKHLNNYITEYIIKKKLDKPINSEDHYTYFPKTKNDLKKNINECIKNKNYDLNCIDTSVITDMSKLFYDSKFKDINIDVSEWDVSNVENMGCMLIYCEKLNCDLSNWNVSKLKFANSMFSHCKNFEGKGLENWDVSNIINMNYMFYECENLNCNLSNWDVSKVQNMSSVFDSCTALKNKPSWCKE